MTKDSEGAKGTLEQHYFKNLGRKRDSTMKKDGKNALIFNGESVAAIRYQITFVP